jgi:hypothetical protein
MLNQIAEAVDRSKFDWRTVRGLAEELDLEETDVADALEHSALFVRSRQPNKRGDAIYTTVRKYRRLTSFFDRALGAAANTVNS